MSGLVVFGLMSGLVLSGLVSSLISSHLISQDQAVAQTYVRKFQLARVLSLTNPEAV